MALSAISIVILSAFVLQSVTFVIKQENYLYASNTQQTEYAHSPFVLVAAAAKGNVKNDRREIAEEFREILQLPQRRRLETVGNDCAPGAFDVECYLRGGECISPFLCNIRGQVFSPYRIIEEPNGNGTLRVLGPEDNNEELLASLNVTNPTARFIACSGVNCGCCIPCQVFTATWPATRCRYVD